MKYVNKVAIAIAIATVTMVSAAVAQEIHNWRNASGEVWKDASGQCWRDANWTPATAVEGCDGAIVPVEPKAASAVKAAPAPMVAAPSIPSVPTPVTPPPAAPAKVAFTVETMFDFDKSVLKPAGKAKLDELVSQAQSSNVETVIAVGHADATGPEGYNQKLSERRAESVKAYLVSKGIDQKLIYTEGKGEMAPAADNSTRAGRAKNRRVDVELVGTRAN